MVSFSGFFRDEASSTVLKATKAMDRGSSKQARQKEENRSSRGVTE